MSALAQSFHNKQADNTQVTAISSLARVDYILRFSKHAVVVVDEEPSEYSNIGSQLLANLPSERNAAYLTVSSKLDDVQIRCRLIEQLFGQVLFDPEQSIAVSMVNLLKQHQQPLSIVVEHAHFLSFQLLHELCQLAEIGKKANLDIQVVMLAQPEVGAKMNQHSLLFHKKLSIISAVSGQLIPLSDSLFQIKNTNQRYSVILKWLTAFAGLVVVSAVIIYQLYQMETFKFSQLPEASQAVVASQVDEPKSLMKMTTETQVFNASSIVEPQAHQQATPGDVRNALLGEADTQHKEFEGEVKNVVMQKATPVDILKSLNESLKTVKAEDSAVNASITFNSEDNASNILGTETKVIENETETLSPFAGRDGLVIQLSVVSNETVVSQLKAKLNSYGALTYQKLVGDRVVTVFTTPIFESRAEAESFTQSLPEEFALGGGFIKSLTAIKAEISAFERSQSEANQVTIPTS